MKKSRLANIHDLLGLIVRQRWLVLIAVIACAGFSIFFALVFPPSYISKTMIMIESRDVPSDFVKDLIGGNTDERLNAIEQTILSRTNLLKIISEFEDQLPEYRALNDERKVLKLKKRIVIDFSSEKVRGVYLPTATIQISYRDRKPDLAQKITARLASLFIEQDNRTRENKVFGTAEFLESELNKVSDQLKQSEDALKKLKQRYRYEMPSELDTSLRTLDRLQVQKNGNLEALDRYVTLQMNLERQISETQPTIPANSAQARGAAGIPGPSAQVQSYWKKEQEYKELSAKAKENHPDMRRLKAELEQLRKEIPAEDLVPHTDAENSGQPAATMVPNPIYQSLNDQLRQLKTDIQIREREKVWVENEMATFNKRVQNMPQAEQEMLAVTRGNVDLMKQHEDLKAKLESAKLASSLESRQKGAQFSIVDPANYPLEPAPPGRSIILLAGLAISIAAGIALAVLANFFNQRIWTHQELERALDAPVLVEIPSMITPADVRAAQKMRVMQALIGAGCFAVYLGGLYFMYLKQAPVLRLLDPLVEKIVERSAG
jgi:polysaccharide chain length determinant protein (PEP-CTERM system associated)